jgi:hypothetical protein
MLPPTQLPTTCDIYRPFGDAAPLAAGVPCLLLPADSGEGGPTFTHALALQPGVDICDGCTRTAGSDALDYADGDEVRVPSGGATRYVVVWVETVARGTPRQFQRAYLLRHSAAFPDP